MWIKARAGHVRSSRVAAALVGVLVLPLMAVALSASPAAAVGTVTVAVVGQGSATGDGIDCTQSGGPDCSEFYPDEVFQECDPQLKPPCHTERFPPEVALTAGPDANGFVYDGWTGCDTVSGRDCQLTVTSDTALTARFRDAQPPTVASTTPSGVHRGTINLTASASDNDRVTKVEFRARGALVATDTAAPYSVSFDTNSVSDGPATLEARAQDASGNIRLVTSSITIDNTGPSLAVTSGPRDETFGPGTTQTWEFTATDATSGISSVRCSVVAEDAAASYGACSGGNGSHSVSGLPGGAYSFSVRATDAAGHVISAAPRHFVIDAQPPSLAIPSPSSGNQKGTISISTSVSDDSGTVSRVEFRVRGVLVATDTTAPYSTSFDTTSVADGSAAIQVRAFDAVGNVATASSSIVIDNTGPSLAVTSGPRDETFGPGTTQTWEFTATDATSGISSVRCSVVAEDAAASYGACSGGNDSHSVSELPGGAYSFSVRSTDAAGNVTTADTSQFVIDALAPTVTRLRPAAGGRTRDRTPLVSAVVRDRVTSEVAGTLARRDLRLVVDGKRRKIGFDGSHVAWHAGKLRLGRHRVKLTVTDAVGNHATKSWSFTVLGRR